MNPKYLVIFVLVVAVIGGTAVNAQDDPLAMNKALVERHILEVFNQGDYETVAEIYAEDAVIHDPLSPEPLDRDGLIAMLEGIRATFPDVAYADYTMLAQDDRVVVQYALTGTFTNEFNGVPPTGEPVTVFGADLWQIADGKIVEAYFVYDTLSMMQQMGAVPTDGEVIVGEPWAVTAGTTTQTPDEVGAVVYAVADSVRDQGFYDIIDTLFAEDCVLHDLSRPEVVSFSGREGVNQWISSMYGALPDGYHPMENARLVAEGDIAAIYMTAEGTFTGEFMGIPGNGNPISFSMLNLWRVKDGQIVEGWLNFETLGFISQLTAAPMMQ
jgi:steroid delta-isomerase-like uncharacterized protein